MVGSGYIPVTQTGFILGLIPIAIIPSANHTCEVIGKAVNRIRAVIGLLVDIIHQQVNGVFFSKIKRAVEIGDILEILRTRTYPFVGLTG